VSVLRKKILLSVFIFISGVVLSSEKSKAGDISPNYVPTEMFFRYSFSGRLWGCLSADMAIYVYFPSLYTGSVGRLDGPEIYTPSLEDWQAFFDVCESSDIWNLGKEGSTIPKDLVGSYSDPHVWLLNLEYPDRKLEIKGEEKDVDIDVYKEYGLAGMYQESGYYTIISDNIDVAMAYEKVQSVWDALGKYIIKGREFPLLEDHWKNWE